MQKTLTFLTLAAVTLAVVPFSAHAADPNSCTPFENGVAVPGCTDNACAQNGVTGNTIAPMPGAGFSVAPSSVHPTVGAQTTPSSVGGQHVGPQSTPGGNTPPADAPSQSLPSYSTPAQDPGLAAQNPGAVTNWTPDCVTIASGDELTFTNADGEAIHFDIFGSCTSVGGKALVVPNVDTDVVKLKLEKTAGVVTSLAVTGTATRTGTAAGIGTNHCLANQKDEGAFGAAPKPAYLWKDMGSYVDVIYTCGVHHNAMVGHVHIKK